MKRPNDLFLVTRATFTRQSKTKTMHNRKDRNFMCQNTFCTRNHHLSPISPSPAALTMTSEKLPAISADDLLNRLGKTEEK
jgi:hypothetical protein